jgi:structural maintenance of chromosomes protein 6
MKRFQGEVTGPIGSYIKVANGKDEFAAAAEFAIGIGVLDRFIVTNDHDFGVMRELRTKAGCAQDCGLYQVHVSSRFRIPGKPDFEGIETVASVLSIENDIVFNCLVDNCSIEKTALVRDRRYSEEKLLVKNGNGASIRGHIKKVYLLNGDYWTTKGGSYAIFSCEKRLRQTIGVDTSSAIEGAQSELSLITQEIRIKQQEEDKLQHEHTTSQREWNQAKRAVQQNDNRINDLAQKIDSIKQDMESSAIFSADTTEFEEAVHEAEEALANLVNDERKHEDELERLRPVVNEAQSKLDTWKVENARALEAVRAAENDLTQFLETQTQQNDQIEKKRRKLSQYKEAVASLENQIHAILADREKSLTKARTLHFRYEQSVKAEKETSEDGDDGENGGDVALEAEEAKAEPADDDLQAIEPQRVNHEPKYYEVRLQKIEEKIQKERARRNVSREDRSVVYERYVRARTDLNAKMKVMDEADQKIEEMEKDVAQRRKRWQQFRKHLAKIIGLKFGQMLTMNKYNGTLQFDHHAGTLDLAVQKDNAESESNLKDVKALR